MANKTEIESFLTTFQIEVLKHESPELRVALHWFLLRTKGRCSLIESLDSSFQQNWLRFFDSNHLGRNWPEELRGTSSSSSLSTSSQRSNAGLSSWVIREENGSEYPLEVLSSVELIKHTAGFHNFKTKKLGYFYQTSEKFVTGSQREGKSPALMVFHRRFNGYPVQPLNLNRVRLQIGVTS